MEFNKFAIFLMTVSISFIVAAPPFQSSPSTLNGSDIPPSLLSDESSSSSPPLTGLLWNSDELTSELPSDPESSDPPSTPPLQQLNRASGEDGELQSPPPLPESSDSSPEIKNPAQEFSVLFSNLSRNI